MMTSDQLHEIGRKAVVKDDYYLCLTSLERAALRTYRDAIIAQVSKEYIEEIERLESLVNPREST